MSTTATTSTAQSLAAWTQQRREREQHILRNTAHNIVAKAKADANLIIRDADLTAEVRANEIIAQAQIKADRIIREARRTPECRATHTEHERLVADAKSMHGQIIREAEGRGERVIREAEARGERIIRNARSEATGIRQAAIREARNIRHPHTIDEKTRAEGQLRLLALADEVTMARRENRYHTKVV